MKSPFRQGVLRLALVLAAAGGLSAAEPRPEGARKGGKGGGGGQGRGEAKMPTPVFRTEVPAQILADIAAGAPGAAVVEDRAAAIRAAVAEAGARDIVLVAGKGHEDYQEVHGVRRPFSDVGEARAALLERAGL